MILAPEAAVSVEAATAGTLSSRSFNSGVVTPNEPLNNIPFSHAQPAQTLAFVDRAIADIDSLIQGLENSTVVLIDTQTNGIDQITQALEQHQNLDSIQIYAHGSEAQLTLGDTALNAANVGQYASELAKWGEALSDSGDLLLYSCNVAAGPSGAAFLQGISAATGADVAASNNLTGQGGDWLLETAIGSIEAENALNGAEQESFEGSLALLSNGGFEADLANWNRFSGRETVASQSAFAGQKSLVLANAGDGTEQIIPANAQQTYRLEGRAKSSSGGNSAIGITFFDANYNLLSRTASEPIRAADWQAYTVESKAPDGTAFAQVWSYRGGGNGTVLIDEVTLSTGALSSPPVTSPTTPIGTPPAISTELVNNGSFESGLANWTLFGGQETVSSTETFSGGRSLKLAGADSGTGQFVSGRAGEKYRLSGHAKSSTQGFSGFGAHFLDANYNVISSMGGDRINTNSWKPYSAEGTAPPGTTFMQVWTYQTLNDGITFIDGLSLTKASGQSTAPPVVTAPPVTAPPATTPPVAITPAPQTPPTQTPPTQTPPTSAPPTSAPPAGNSGGPTAEIFVTEGTPFVTAIPGAGSGLSYAIAGGADAEDFSIEQSTGKLSFKAAPDYERPIDADANNVYDVKVEARNGTQVAEARSLSVKVKNKVSVFLMGGQSNMSGIGLNRELTGDLAQPYDAVKMWDTEKFTSLKPGFSGAQGNYGEFGPELTFGRGINGATQEEVYLIKHAEGATNLANDWDPDGANNREHDIFVDRVGDALGSLTAQNVSYDIEGMLWMQGESDSGLAPASVYANNLTAFIQDMRDRYNPNLKFVVGKIHPAFGEDVRTAQESVAAADPLTYIVNTDAMALRSDGVHYNTAGQIDLGYAFANAIKGS